MRDITIFLFLRQLTKTQTVYEISVQIVIFYDDNSQLTLKHILKILTLSEREKLIPPISI